jgi:hypothetical protein
MDNNTGFALIVTNDTPEQSECWGPYASEALALEVADAFVQMKETVRVERVTDFTVFTGRPE